MRTWSVAKERKNRCFPNKKWRSFGVLFNISYAFAAFADDARYRPHTQPDSLYSTREHGDQPQFVVEEATSQGSSTQWSDGKVVKRKPWE